MGGEEGTLMKKRADLLALTIDDLMVLSNRGLVKRAQKELAAGKLSYEMEEMATGALKFVWSDEAVCELPKDEALGDRHCNCTATTLCRHLIRSVLAYQAEMTALSAESTTDSSPLKDSITQKQAVSPVETVWNPGDITDDVLKAYFRPAQLKKLKQEFTANQVIEVTRSRKPTAQLHSFPHTLRFLVPHDPRYTYCDCIYDSPCPHVPLAIWAFRQLPPQQISGIISTETGTASTPEDLLNDIEKALSDLAEMGLAGLSPGFITNLEQLEDRCHRAYLIWPANIIQDLITCCNFYRTQDARFSPEQVIDLVSELCIRCDAIRAHTGLIPQLMIRGPRLKRLSELGNTRLIGLGCGARVQRQSFSLEAYFQDTDSGQVLACVSHLHALHNPQNSAKTTSRFQNVAQTHAFKQTPWKTLGAGQLLIKRGACSPDGQLRLKRNQTAIVNPQRFEWEKLRAPILVEDFVALEERLRSRPPKSLRPRRLTEDFHVFAISHIENVKFSSIEQSVVATVFDQYNNRASLSFPYMNQAHDGAETLLSVLAYRKVCFISGHASMRSMQMQIMPTALVFERDDGRRLLQPWIYDARSGMQATSGRQSVMQAATAQTVEKDPIENYMHGLASVLSNRLVTGLSANRMSKSAALSSVIAQGRELGFHKVADRLQGLKDEGDRDSFDADLSVQKYLMILVLVKAFQ